MGRNPYTAGFPISGQDGFFGRSDLLRDLIESIGQSRSLTLRGQRMIGKTSLLHRLEELLGLDSYFPIFFSAEGIYIRSMSSVLAEIADKVQLAITERFDIKLDKVDPASFDDNGDFFRRSFIPRVYRAIGERSRPILLIDEFDALCDRSESRLPSTAAGNSFAPFLKRLLDADTRLHCVFCVGPREDLLSPDIRRLLETSPTVPIWVLRDADARELILQAERNGTLAFREEAVDDIITRTHGHPYLTQVLCDLIWNHAYSSENASKTIGTSEVDAASRKALGTYRYGLSSMEDGLEPAEKLFLRALCEGSKQEYSEQDSAQEAMGVLGKEDIALDIMVKLDHAPSALINKKFLAREGRSGYKFLYPLFRDWVESQPFLDVVLEVGSHDAETEKDVARGEELIWNKKWREANSLFSEVLARRPRNCTALAYRGQAFMELGNLPKALNDLRKAYQLKPWVVEKTLARALTIYAKEMAITDEDRARQIVEEALKVVPGEREASNLREFLWNSKGDRASRRGDLTAALSAYQRSGDSQRITRTRELLGPMRGELGKKVSEDLDAMIAISARIGTKANRIAQRTKNISLLEGIDNDLRAAWRAVGRIFGQEECLNRAMTEVFLCLKKENFQLALSMIREKRTIVDGSSEETKRLRSLQRDPAQGSRNSERAYQDATESVVGWAWDLSQEMAALQEMAAEASELATHLGAHGAHKARYSEAEPVWREISTTISARQGSFRKYWEGMRFLRSKDIEGAKIPLGLEGVSGGTS